MFAKCLVANISTIPDNLTLGGFMNPVDKRSAVIGAAILGLIGLGGYGVLRAVRWFRSDKAAEEKPAKKSANG